MLNNYFIDPAILSRLMDGIAGPHLDEFTRILCNKGYSWWTVRNYVRVAHHLGFWLHQNNYSFEVLTKNILGEFCHHLSSCDCPVATGGSGNSVPGSRHFFNYLIEKKIVSAPADNRSLQQMHPLALDFGKWMKQQRGVCHRTVELYQPVVLEVLKIFGEEPEYYQLQDIRNFIIETIKNRGNSQAKTIAKALRMFLRYLVAHGLCSHQLVDAVPRIASWRFASLPRSLPAYDIEKIIDSCANDTLAGCRDKAILLLLARLGLRGDDIAKMLIDDINWTEGSIRFSGKGRREDLLPLTQEVGNALIDYLLIRPEVQYKHVFVKVVAPVEPLTSGSTVSRIVCRAIRRAGVKSPSHGAYVFRHSAATTMLAQGVSLQGIAGILRHRSIETTRIYAKVDESLLNQIAQPWPEM